jgi:hypothetical protein
MRKKSNMIFEKILIYYKINFAKFEDFLFYSNSIEKNFSFQKERQIEQLQFTIDDHERTILKFRETVKNMQVCFSPIISLII